MRPYKTNKIENEPLKKDIAKKKEFNFYNKCDIKAGVVSQIVTKDEKKRELTLQPVYYQLNTISLNLYDSLGKDAQLLGMMNIEKIARLLEIYSGTHCITFVLRSETKKEFEGMTICPDSEKDKDEMVHMITEFKECEINVHQSERNEEVILDFAKVNYLLSEKNRTDSLQLHGPGFGKTNEEELLDGMWYDNSQKVVRKSPQAVMKTTAMKKEMHNIIKELQLSNLAQKKIQREFQSKIKAAEKIAKDVEKQKEIVREILQKRAQKEKERKAVILRKATQNKELKLMKAVRMQILKIKKQEMIDTKLALKKQLNFIKGIPEPKIKKGGKGTGKGGKGGKGSGKGGKGENGEPTVEIPLDAYDAGVFAGSLPAGVGSPLSKALIARYGPLGDNKLNRLARVPGKEKKFRALSKKAAKQNKIAVTNSKNSFLKLTGKGGKRGKGGKGSGKGGKGSNGFSSTTKLSKNKNGKTVVIDADTFDSPDKYLQYNTCTQKDRLWGNFYFIIIF